MNELHRRILAGRQGRERADAVKDYVDQANGGVFDPAVLQDLADGPILDPNAIYLPAGKLTEKEYRARLRAMNAKGSHD